MGPRRRLEDRAALLRRQLADNRGGRVLMVSHCLLNENVRYLGGAARPGAVDEIVDLARSYGVGLHQLPCPEMQAWGGVDKLALLPMYGARDLLLHRHRRALLAAFDGYTWLAYRRLARKVVRDVLAYRAADVDVIGLVGVAASPSCGVHTTLDLHRACDVVASCPLAQIDRAFVNAAVVAGTAKPGSGAFVDLIRDGLRRRGESIDLFEHDQPREIRGDRTLPTGLRDRLAAR
jgi:predicted secreted protein